MPRQSPNSLDEFLRRPSWQAWQAELSAGWLGPDGSSMSTDTVMGVRVGVTSPDHGHSNLPANRHDWYYRLGRRHSLPERWRRAADARYRDLCLFKCEAELTGWRHWRYPLAWVRAHARYAALRATARFAWTARAKVRQKKWNAD